MRKKILVTGIPWTGKTTIGNHLQEKHGFVHLDMESNGNREIIQKTPKEFMDKIMFHDGNIIVTWWFPVHVVDIINSFGDYGFKIFWFDWNRESAFREFEKRDMKISKDYWERQKIAFKQQIERIDSSNVVDYINNVKIINTFNSDGEFLSTEEIAEYIFEN